MSAIRDWLDALGLARYAETFEREEIEPEDVAELDDTELAALGLPLGPRKRILKAVVAPATAVPPREAERRQITVMFCDLVGSTALSEKLDPEDLRTLMQSYQQAAGAVIEHYGGHVAQYLGDGLMTYFGWPQAHEDDAERAVRASLDIVEAVNAIDLAVRIGIATGPVVVGETGAGDASVPKLAVGETPNLAARLQGLASADEIVIGPSTRRLLGGTFELVNMGEQALKGIVEPVQAHRITGIAATEGRFEAQHQHLTPLVGREAEMAMVMVRWEQAKAGEGRVILLSGEPGIGKSRITQTLRERIAEERHTRLRYQCSPYHTNSALHPVIEQIERAANFSRDDTPDEKLDKLDSLLPIGAGRALVAALLSLPTERYPALDMSPQKQKEETLRVLAEGMAALAAVEPVLLIFEDAHWIDPTSQELLDLMVPAVAGHPVLAVITPRPEFVPPWLSQGHVTLLALSRLGRAEAAAMIARVSDDVLPDDVLDQIVARTDGVPLFVEELTKTVAEGSGGGVPETLQDSLMARLDRLGTAKEVAQVGACIGREFSGVLLAAVSSLDEDALAGALHKLVTAELMYHTSNGYMFKHALMQDAAHESLLRERRKELHGQIARVIEERFPSIVGQEPEVIARHYSAGDMSEPASEYWYRAGQHAVARSANTEACQHFKNALAMFEELPESNENLRREADILLAFAVALRVSHGYNHPELQGSYARARALSEALGDTEKHFRALFGLWGGAGAVGDYRGQDEFGRECLRIAESVGEQRFLLAAHRMLGSAKAQYGDHAVAREHLERAIDIYDPEQHSSEALTFGYDPQAISLGYLSGALWHLGYPDQAAATNARALRHKNAEKHGGTRMAVLSYAALLSIFRREHEEARAISERLIAESDELGHSATSAWGRIFRGWALSRLRPEPENALETRRAFEESVELWGLMSSSTWAVLVADACLAQYETGYALHALATAEDFMQSSGEHRMMPELYRLRGDIAIAAAETGEAESMYCSAIESALADEAKSLELRAATSLAQFWQSQGKTTEARDLLAPVYGWFTEGFDTADLKDAKALLDALG